MLLNELFDKPVHYWWVNKTSEPTWSGEFIIEDNKYNVLLFIGKSLNLIVSFYITGVGYDYGHDITGSGNEFLVFSTVVAMIKEFIKNHQNVEKIVFSSKNTEPSRMRLYDRFCKTFGKKRCEKVQDDGFINYEIGL